MKKTTFTNKYFKKGTYSIGLTAVVLAVVIVINLIAGELPSNIKNIDISSTDIYSITDTTKNILDTLEKDVKIVILAQESNIDTRITRFVDIYKDQSDKVSVEIIDPVQHPTALTTYEAEEDSVVVSCESTGKSRAIAMTDIIQYDEETYYYYGTKEETAFDGEGQITSAIDYVTNSGNHMVYTTSGHGEAELATGISDALEKQNFTVSSVNLLADGGIPDDCELLMIHGITKDLAKDELTMLNSYMNKGGSAYVILGAINGDTPNLDSFLETYGLKMAEGYIVDTSRYYQNDPYTFFPVGDTSHEAFTNVGTNDYALIYGTLGLEKTSEDNTEVEAFLTTSQSAYAVTDKSEKSGTYILGARVERSVNSASLKMDTTTTAGDATTAGNATTDSDADSAETIENPIAQLTVLSSANFISDTIMNQFSNLANSTIFMNTVTANFEDVENISIPSKSLEIQMNTVATGGLFGIVFVAIIPLGMIICGFIVWRRRRKA